MSIQKFNLLMFCSINIVQRTYCITLKRMTKKITNRFILLHSFQRATSNFFATLAKIPQKQVFYKHTQRVSRRSLFSPTRMTHPLSNTLLPFYSQKLYLVTDERNYINNNTRINKDK